jgi:thiamine biosynthesis protein ThiS
MKIKFNGTITELSCDIATLDALAGIKANDKDGLITMVNQHHVRHEDWKTCKLSDGDIIEFFTFAGGG